MSEGGWWWTRILIKETRQKEAKDAVHAISAISESITWLLQTTNARIIEINSIYIYVIELWPKSRKSIAILSCNELSFFLQIYIWYSSNSEDQPRYTTLDRLWMNHSKLIVPNEYSCILKNLRIQGIHSALPPLLDTMQSSRSKETEPKARIENTRKGTKNMRLKKTGKERVVPVPLDSLYNQLASRLTYSNRAAVRYSKLT